MRDIVSRRNAYAQKGSTNFHAQLRLPDKGRGIQTAIKSHFYNRVRKNGQGLGESIHEISEAYLSHGKVNAMFDLDKFCR